MVSLRVGEKWQSTITGKVYRIKMIKDRMIVLESVDGLSQVLTNRETIYLFYSMVFHAEDGQSESRENVSLPSQEKKPSKKIT